MKGDEGEDRQDRPDGSHGGGMTHESKGGRQIVTLNPDLLWPVLIAGGLVVVVLVNVLFIYIAVSGADAVAPSYVLGER